MCLQGSSLYSQFTVFLEGHILQVLFDLINLIVAYPLNENKPQLQETFENWEVAEHLLNFLALFQPEHVVT